MNGVSMRRATSLGTLAMVLVMTLFSGQALASQRPTINFRLTANGQSGVATEFTYSVQDVPLRASFVLQRAEGTGGVWRTIEKLQPGNGSGTVPALGIGTWRVRLAVLVVRNRHSVAIAQAVHSLNVFGVVSLPQLLGTPVGSVTIPNSVYSYAFDTYDGAVNYVALAVGTSNPCSSLSLSWVAGTPSVNDPYDPSQGGTVTVVQESLDPVATSAAMGIVTQMQAVTLVPGQPWSITVAQTQSSGYLFDWYFNGTAVCDRVSLRNASIDPGGI